METIEVADWGEFESRVKELRKQYDHDLSPLIFRGQSDSTWTLSTTLERSGANGMLFRNYYRLICGGIGPEVRTMAAVDVPTYDPDLAKPFLEAGLLTKVGDIFPEGVYRYMAHLRHFGFPSPLLDWSRSPYVAAFFAFRDMAGARQPEKRSIFAYCGNPLFVRACTLGEPQIRGMGPYVHTHQRHFRQRCDYTICGRYVTDLGWGFESHGSVFERPSSRQDFLWKIDIPSSERRSVLTRLNDYNLNAFSLFGTHESLFESMWFREYEMRSEYRR